MIDWAINGICKQCANNGWTASTARDMIYSEFGIEMEYCEVKDIVQLHRNTT